MEGSRLTAASQDGRVSRRSGIVALLLAFLFLAPNLAQAASDAPYLWWAPAANLGICLFSALVCARRSRLEADARAGWLWVAAASLAAGLGPFHTYLTILWRESVPTYPSAGDWASYLALPFAGIGALCFPLWPICPRRQLRLALDGLAFVASLLFILVVAAYHSPVRLNYSHPHFREASLAQLALIVVDLAILLFLVRDHPRSLKGPLGLFALALLVCAIPAFLALRLVVPERAYASGHVIHVLHSGALLLLCLGALSPWPVAPVKGAEDVPPLWRLSLAAAPFFPPTVTIVLALWVLSGNRIIIWSGVAAFLFLFLRLAVALLDSWQLSRTLEDRVRERTRQLEESQSRLAQNERLEALGRLAGGVAHDFNNLLTVILGNAHYLAEDSPDGSPSRELAQQICFASERAASLTKQLLTFARRQPTRPRIFAPSQVLQEIQTFLRRTIGENISLVVRSDPGAGSVKMDPHQFEQVVLNLAINARDAMPDGGRLELETSAVTLDEDQAARLPDARPGCYVRLRVLDHGTGIPSEALERIFDPFFTTKDQGRGTGLGLAICYGIVKDAGGYILVETHVGQGTCFDIHLPVTREKLDAPALPPALSAYRGTARILVAEDEPGVRNLIASVLGTAGYDVLLANNGTEAIELARTHPAAIDLFLTDLVMPGMSGLAAAHAVKEEHPETRIVVMSGYSHDLSNTRTLLGEDIPFLPKPISPHVLLERVWQQVQAPKQADEQRNNEHLAV